MFNIFFILCWSTVGQDRTSSCSVVGSIFLYQSLIKNSCELRFDMFDGEYTHEGDRCTFEVMIRQFQFQDRVLVSLAEVVHDIDLKESKYDRAETDGFNALLTGIVACETSDDQRLAEGCRLFENLYIYFQRRK